MCRVWSLVAQTNFLWRPTALRCRQTAATSVISAVLSIGRLMTLIRATLSTVWVKKNCGFVTFFPKWVGIFNQYFTHLLQVPFYTTLQIFIQLSPIWRSYAILSATTPNEFLHFTRSLTSMFVFWANDVTVWRHRVVISDMFVDIIKVFIL